MVVDESTGEEIGEATGSLLTNVIPAGITVLAGLGIARGFKEQMEQDKKARKDAEKEENEKEDYERRKILRGNVRVRKHQRKLPSGKVTTVRSHTRKT